MFSIFKILKNLIKPKNKLEKKKYKNFKIKSFKILKSFNTQKMCVGPKFFFPNIFL